MPFLTSSIYTDATHHTFGNRSSYVNIPISEEFLEGRAATMEVRCKLMLPGKFLPPSQTARVFIQGTSKQWYVSGGEKN